MIAGSNNVREGAAWNTLLKGRDARSTRGGPPEADSNRLLQAEGGQLGQAVMQGR